MSELTLAQRLAQFVAGTSYERLPGDVARSVKQRVLDTVGICVAASGLQTSEAARSYVASCGGRPQATAVGVSEPLPATSAAFLNGVLAHSLDYDDTHLPSVLHPSASIVPAALAVAEMTAAPGSRLIAAVACGLEVCVRTGMAGYDERSRNSAFFEHGQHATSICGTLGAAVAAGLLLGLDARQLCDAIGIAASMGSGIIEANRAGGTVKRVHCGWAAHSGVSAAMLARAGVTGPPTVLEGRFGFYEAWLHGAFDPTAITDGLGDEWAVPGIFFKPYPANHFTHTAVDAARALRARGVRAADIADAVLGVAGPTVRTIGEPIALKRAPETGYSAKFSGPYAVAAGFLGDGHGLGVGEEDYTDVLAHDPRRRALMARVSVVADAECDRIFPYQFPAVLRVKTTYGRTLTERVLANRGGPDRPLSDAELATKFRNNTDRLMSDADAERLQQAITGLAGAPGARPLLPGLSELSNNN